MKRKYHPLVGINLSARKRRKLNAIQSGTVTSESAKLSLELYEDIELADEFEKIYDALKQFYESEKERSYITNKDCDIYKCISMYSTGKYLACDVCSDEELVSTITKYPNHRNGKLCNFADKWGNECDTFLCKNCREQNNECCRICEGMVCAIHLTAECDQCGDRICDDCALSKNIKCSDCNNMYCESCVYVTDCSGCDRNVCESCTEWSCDCCNTYCKKRCRHIDHCLACNFPKMCW
eukprot:UN09612